MTKYIWELPSWTQFTWDANLIITALGEARKQQGIILAQGKLLKLSDQAEILIEETIATSAIEGEKLDRDSIRSSVARRLGLPTAGLSEIKRNVDGVVQVLMDATANHSTPLSAQRLGGWQAALFPSGFSGIHKIVVGEWRNGQEPMRVVSGPMGKEKIHYEAPPSKQITKEMDAFLAWWNSPPPDLDGVIRAALAHLWFVTIHPFEDGNGRIARAITDMALAQDEKTGVRLYSLSSQIIKERNAYYAVLESVQKGNGDITQWLKWFLEMFTKSIQNSHQLIEKSLLVGNFYEYYKDKNLNERQVKILHKMIEALPSDFIGGMTNHKYVSMTKVSAETAKRDLRDLVEKGILLPSEKGGRSTSYQLDKSFFSKKSV